MHGRATELTQASGFRRRHSPLPPLPAAASAATAHTHPCCCLFCTGLVTLEAEPRSVVGTISVNKLRKVEPAGVIPCIAASSTASVRSVPSLPHRTPPHPPRTHVCSLPACRRRASRRALCFQGPAAPRSCWPLIPRRSPSSSASWGVRPGLAPSSTCSCVARTARAAACGRW